LFFSLFSHPVFAHSGDSFGTRGGGNGTVAYFYDTGRKILQTLAVQSPIQAGENSIDIKKLQKMFDTTTVKIIPRDLVLNGSVVDAINYPHYNLIHLNGITFDKLPMDRKRQIVIHEVLGLAHIPDPGYRVSEYLLGKAGMTTPNKGRYVSTCYDRREVHDQSAKDLVQLITGTPYVPMSHPIMSGKISCGFFESQGNYSCLVESNNKLYPKDYRIVLPVLEGMLIAPQFFGNDAYFYEATDVVCYLDEHAGTVACSVSALWNFGCYRK
jgi:hypothetical protein